MEVVSFHHGSMPHRWRPDGQVTARMQQAWQPARSAASTMDGRRRSLAQVRPVAVADVGLSMVTSLGLTFAGFGLAIMGGRENSTWRWIGGIAGSVGVLRLLHDVSKF